MQSSPPSAPNAERRATENNPPPSTSRSTRRVSARRQESEAPGHGHTPVHSSPAASKSKRKLSSRVASTVSTKNHISKSTPKKKKPSLVKKVTKIRTDPRGPEPADSENIASSPAELVVSASKVRKTVTPQSVQDKIGELAKKCELGSDPTRPIGSSSPSKKASKNVETRSRRIQSPQTFSEADNNSSRPQSPVVGVPALAMGGGIMRPQPVVRSRIPLIPNGPLESFMARYSASVLNIPVVSEYFGVVKDQPTHATLHSSRSTPLAPSHGSSNPASTRPTPNTANLHPLDGLAVSAKKAWERSIPPPPALQGFQASTLMDRRNGTPTVTSAAASIRPQQLLNTEVSRALVAAQDAGFNENIRPGFSSNKLSSPQDSSIIRKRRSSVSTAPGNIQNCTPGTPAASKSQTGQPKKNPKILRSPLAKQGTSHQASAVANANPILFSRDIDVTNAPNKSGLNQQEAEQKGARCQTQPTHRPTSSRFEHQSANPYTSNTTQAQYGNQCKPHSKVQGIASLPIAPALKRLKGCNSCFNLKNSTYQNLSFPQRHLLCNNCQRVVSTEIHGHYEGPELQPGHRPPEPGIMIEIPTTLLNRGQGLDTEDRNRGGDWWKEGSYHDAEMDGNMVEWDRQWGVLETDEKDIAGSPLAVDRQELKWRFYEGMEFGELERQFLSGS